MLQTNSKPPRPSVSATAESLVSVPAILLADSVTDISLRANIERACQSCRASVHSLDHACRNGLPAGVRACLLISLLPLGERRVPADVSDAVAQHFPGIPILLLCQEQLTRPTVSVEEGRVILIGQPFTDEKIGAHIRSVIESLPPPAIPRPRTQAAVARSATKVIRTTSAPRQSDAGPWKATAIVLGVVALVVALYALINIFSSSGTSKVSASNPPEKIAAPEQVSRKVELPEIPAVKEPVAQPKESVPAPFLDVELAPGESLALCLIPTGKFEMGSPLNEVGHDDDDDSPRSVTIERPYYLSKFEVTQNLYAAVMGVNPSQFKDPRRPVDTVSFFDANEFCEKARQRTGKSIRLPTEAEWEYACRAGTRTSFSFGDTLTDQQANIDGNFSGPSQTRETVTVGSYAPNAFGLFDMHGNVWEWCQANVDKNALQVLRGGAWSVSARHARSANRHLYQAGGRNADFGFRIVVELPVLSAAQQNKSK